MAHHHNDGEHLCCPDSSLALEKPERQGGVLAGDSGTGGLPTRLFDLFKGSHWTLIGYEVERLSGVKPRPVLHIRAVGTRGDVADDGRHIYDGYGVRPGDWIRARPDGYVGVIVSSVHISVLDAYLEQVGLRAD